MHIPLIELSLILKNDCINVDIGSTIMNIKDKLPDLNEVSGIAKKLYVDVKKSVTEIIKEYKVKRDNSSMQKAATKEEPVPSSQSATIKNDVKTGTTNTVNTETTKKEKEPVA
jgi:hypothetical protein